MARLAMKVMKQNDRAFMEVILAFIPVYMIPIRIMHHYQWHANFQDSIFQCLTKGASGLEILRVSFVSTCVQLGNVVCIIIPAVANS
jgi:hypothetical protein